MQLTHLWMDDDAVSPVIGVILMVAITVILAAVIGTFVLGLGGQVGNTAPSAQLEFTYEAGEPNTESYADNRSYKITHDGGEQVKNSTINVKEDGREFGSEPYGGSDTYSAGDTVFNRSQVAANSGNFNAAEAGDTVEVIWSAQDSDKSTVLASSEVPQ